MNISRCRDFGKFRWLFGQFMDLELKDHGGTFKPKTSKYQIQFEIQTVKFYLKFNGQNKFKN